MDHVGGGAALRGAPLVVARGLVQVHDGGVRAPDGVDLELLPAELLVVAGPNGAGKSTLLRLLSGTEAPAAGSVLVAGLDPRRDPLGVRRLIGLLPPGDETLERLTGRECIALIARLHGLATRDAERRADELCELFALSARDRGRLLATYSTGMRRKVQIACALVHAPRVLLLDEPFAGLDATAAETLRALARRLADGGVAVVLASHARDGVAALADRVAVLADGRLAACGTMPELRTSACVGADASLDDVLRALLRGSASGDVPEWLR